MRKRRRLIEQYHYLSSEQLDISNWPSVLEEELSSDNRKKFEKRKQAIEMYFNSDKTLQEIVLKTSIHVDELRRYIRRCLSFDENGEMYGFRALIPRKRTKRNQPMENQETEGFANAFQRLLKTYPNIEEMLIQTYLRKNNYKVQDNLISIKHLHSKFLKICRAIGIKSNEYPFNTKDGGYRTLVRYVQQIEHKYADESVKRYGSQKEGSLHNTGGFYPKNTIVTRPFQQVQLDGHKIDVELAIKFKTLEGDEIINTLNRVYLLIIIDVGTRVVLGYHLCFEREYDQNDVLKCIKNAIIPHKKIHLTIPRLSYPSNGGYHSIAIPDTRWAVWDEIMMDNAKSHLANRVRTNLKENIGCMLNYGPVKLPEYRGIVERFFRTLAENGFHRIPSTTGSHPNDPKRRKSDKLAMRYEISFEELQQLIEILIAQYNNTPHNAVNNLTPLEAMEQRIKREGEPRIVSESDQKNFNLLNIKATRKIQGGVKAGRKPFITFEGVSYTSEVLARSYDLAGKKLVILADTDDLRNIRVFLEDGSEFGILTASGKWGIRPHDLKTRKAISKLKRERAIRFSETDDPIEIYHEYLQEKSIKNKPSRNKLNKLNQTLKKYENKQKSTNEPQEQETKKQELNQSKTIPEEHIVQRKLPELTKTIIF
ncbi:Mu transposase C-terminal domain-containing protein [Bacillus pacificus]|uniref:Mu transposase C-terminal domain-containing protein n=1 Tax=Bacillus pacificus TaxID=2026187 RepID=UPI003D1C8723